MTMFRRVLTASVVAITLASVPSHAAPKESPTRAAERVAALDWFSSLWNEIATWLAGETQGGCAVDPNGCPGFPEPQSAVDGGCAVDPNGGCGS